MKKKKENKILINNFEQFIKYFDEEIQNIYVAKIKKTYDITFEDNTSVQFIIEQV